MPRSELHFALNHMIAPQLGLSDFFALARAVGLRKVEIRNDISANAILDGTSANEVRRLANNADVEIISINALQRFNDWSEERAEEARILLRFAAGCGAKALVLVPVNDGSGRANGERQGNLRVALKALKPLLNDHGIVGLVECLGFETCSLRSKREAVDAINSIEGDSVFRIVHDTFHHHLAGEEDIFPEMTGLVHISGVSDTDIGVSEMRDEHRGLIDSHDRLHNLEQMSALLNQGYSGPFSFEPFAEELRALENPARTISESIDSIRTNLVSQAA